MREHRPKPEQPGVSLAEAARACIGTRWHHQGRVAGAGLDCVGLVAHACRAIGVEGIDSTDYGRTHDRGRLLHELAARFDEVPLSAVAVGDILAFSWTDKNAHAQHVAVVSGIDPLRIVHAHARQRGVVEHDAGIYWSEKIAAVYRIKAETK